MVEAAGVELRVGSVESVAYRKREALIPPVAPQDPRSGTKQVHASVLPSHQNSFQH